MRRIAVVTEGPSDFLLLRDLIRSINQDGIEVVPVHPEVPLAAYPEFDEAVGGARLGTGWKGVQAWCAEFGAELDLFMNGVAGREYVALVIHLDASMAHNIGCERPCPPAQDVTDCIRGVVGRNWLGFMGNTPPFLVFATPSKSSDTWVLAVKDPAWPDLECEETVEAELVRRRLLRRKNGRVVKPRRQYERLAAEVARNRDALRARCPEADRFLSGMEQALALTANV